MNLKGHVYIFFHLNSIAVQMDNYTLYMNRVLGKRDLLRLISNLTLNDAQMTMNLSIQNAVNEYLNIS